MRGVSAEQADLPNALGVGLESWEKQFEGGFIRLLYNLLYILLIRIYFPPLVWLNIFDLHLRKGALGSIKLQAHGSRFYIVGIDFDHILASGMQDVLESGSILIVTWITTG